MPDLFAGIDATDEDLYLLIGADYAQVTDRATLMGFGSDGQLDAIAPWLFISASANFQAQGVQVGHVVVVEFPKATGRGVEPAATLAYAVDPAAPGVASITLRHPGLPAGAGNPPGATAYLGLRYRVPTSLGLLAECTRRARERLRIPPLAALNRAGELGRVVALTAAEALYRAAYRVGEKGPDSFDSKSRRYGVEAEREFGRLELVYGLGVSGQRAAATPTPSLFPGGYAGPPYGFGSRPVAGQVAGWNYRYPRPYLD